MNTPHPVGLHSRSDLEGVHPQFVLEGMKQAREKTQQALREICNRLKPGMTEPDARKVALEVCAEVGTTKHWHQPYIRFGKGTTFTFSHPLDPSRRLEENGIYYVDLGPTWLNPELGLEYEGDLGDTFVFGTHSEFEKLSKTVRKLFLEAQTEWKTNSATGEKIYELLGRRAQELGYLLVDDIDGHRLSDFPHQRYSKESLGGVKFHPSETIWVLEVQIKHPTLEVGAFYEDLL